MKVFVTGASGFVGSAVVADLIRGGHAVMGLARSDQAAAEVSKAGAEVIRGDLHDLENLARTATAADGIVHCGFNHDFSKMKDNCEQDRRVIGALAQAFEGSPRPLVVTSALGILPPHRVSTESDRPARLALNPRVATEKAAEAARARGVNVSVVRLPPSVHGAGDHAFVPALIALSKEKKLAAYPGDGQNRWPAVHRFDAARLYCAAVAKGIANATYHAVAEEGLSFRAIAEAIGQKLGVPVKGLTGEAAAAHFGWFEHFANMDVPASSERTRHALDWTPREVGLLEDIGQNY